MRLFYQKYWILWILTISVSSTQGFSKSLDDECSDDYSHEGWANFIYDSAIELPSRMYRGGVGSLTGFTTTYFLKRMFPEASDIQLLAIAAIAETTGHAGGYMSLQYARNVYQSIVDNLNSGNLDLDTWQGLAWEQYSHILDKYLDYFGESFSFNPITGSSIALRGMLVYMLLEQTAAQLRGINNSHSESRVISTLIAFLSAKPVLGFFIRKIYDKTTVRAGAYCYETYQGIIDSDDDDGTCLYHSLPYFSEDDDSSEDFDFILEQNNQCFREQESLISMAGFNAYVKKKHKPSDNLAHRNLRVQNH